VSDERVITVERTVRKRNRVVFVGIVGTLCVCMASAVGWFVDGLACIDDTTSRELAYCHQSGAEVVMPLFLSLAGPPVLALIATVIGVRRRRYWPALVATIILVPLTVFIALVFGT